MSSQTIQLITFIVLLVHGIGHFQGVAASLGVKINSLNPAKSWFLKRNSETINKRLCFVLFALAGITGTLTALSFWNIIISQSAWQALAIATAFFSTTCLIVFPNGFAMFFNKTGAISVNLIIFYSVLLSQKWPSALFLN